MSQIRVGNFFGAFVLQNAIFAGHHPVMTRPLIGISCCVKTFGPQTLLNHAASDSCVRAVEQWADAVPVLLPASGSISAIGTLLHRLDGILLSGSRSMVAPVHYGGPPLPEDMKEDEARDATTLPLIRAAVRRGVPVLAICRGLQELNVALGGSLHQNLKALPGRLDHGANQQAEPHLRFAKVHGVTLRQGGMLHRLAEAREIQVNSLHYQGIDRLASGLVVEAQAPDGTIESVSLAGEGGFALGVQWHPEGDCESDALSRRIFETFGQAARAPAMALAAD
jgi:putative glutamine amidotransferase